MKKVLIYTYKHSNYGAVLQAYALQTYLKNNFPVDVKIVDFTTDKHLKEDSLVKTSGSIPERIIISLCNLLHVRELKRRNSRIESFKRDNYQQTNRFSTIEDLMKNNPAADIYITGSDQVFNPHSQYLPVYYLGFAKRDGIKVAYAPSFGISNFSKQITDKISPYLADFDYISCRETVGADYIASIINRQVPTVCDPTLLLEPSDWAAIAQKPIYRKKEYILVYEINGGDKIIQLAKKISKEKGLPIVCITRKTHKHYNVDKIVRDAGPAEFVGWFKEASCVVTDSFHGTVFSWMFNKEFFYYLAYEGTSSRVKNLLGHIGCTERIVEEKDFGGFSTRYYKTYKRINLPLIEKSKEYIDSFINHV